MFMVDTPRNNGANVHLWFVVFSGCLYEKGLANTVKSCIADVVCYEKVLKIFLTDTLGGNDVCALSRKLYETVSWNTDSIYPRVDVQIDNFLCIVDGLSYKIKSIDNPYSWASQFDAKRPFILG